VRPQPGDGETNDQRLNREQWRAGSQEAEQLKANRRFAKKSNPTKKAAPAKKAAGNASRWRYSFAKTIALR